MQNFKLWYQFKLFLSIKQVNLRAPQNKENDVFIKITLILFEKLFFLIDLSGGM